MAHSFERYGQWAANEKKRRQECVARAAAQLAITITAATAQPGKQPHMLQARIEDEGILLSNPGAIEELLSPEEQAVLPQARYIVNEIMTAANISVNLLREARGGEDTNG